MHFYGNSAKKLVVGEAIQASPFTKIGVVEVELIPSVNMVQPLPAPVVFVRIGDYLVPFLVDTGADCSLITLQVIQRICCEVKGTRSALNSASGHSINVIGEARISLIMGEQEYIHDFVVVAPDRVSFLGVIGTDFLVQKSAVIDVAKLELRFHWGSMPMRPRNVTDGMVYIKENEKIPEADLSRDPILITIRGERPGQETRQIEDTGGGPSRRTPVSEENGLNQGNAKRPHLVNDNFIAIRQSEVRGQRDFCEVPPAQLCIVENFCSQKPSASQVINALQDGEGLLAETTVRSKKPLDESPFVMSSKGKEVVETFEQDSSLSSKEERTFDMQAQKSTQELEGGVVHIEPHSGPDGAQRSESEEKVERRPVFLEKPLKLGARKHTFFRLQTNLPAGSTVYIINSREGATYGVCDSTAVVDEKGRVPAIFSNCTKRTVMLPKGEVKNVTVEIEKDVSQWCHIESEWFKNLREKEDFAYCSTCGEQGPVAKTEETEVRCESCESARKGETRDPPLWPPTPAPVKTDEEFLALFDFGPDTLGVHDELKKVLLKHKEAFVHGEFDLGHTKLLECEIDTGNHPPINCPPYKVPFAQRPALEEALTDMLLRKVIEPTDSPWAFPLVVVPKKGPNGEFTSIRVCADLRKLNAICEKKSFHFTTLEEIFEAFGEFGGEAIFMHTLDFQTGFWQIGMSADAARKCSISTPFGHYSFVRMPFGYIHAPYYFCKLMAEVLKDLIGKFVQIFIDDCLLWHFTPLGSIELLDKVLERVEKSGLRLNPAKCKFLKTEVDFLGHSISKEGLRPNSQKVKALRELKPGKTLKGVRSISGSFNFYRKFIKNYTTIMEPIHKLLKGGGKSNSTVFWTEEAVAALEEIKEAMTTAPVLKFPQRGRRFHLKVDTSALGIGAVLEQCWPTGKHPVAFFSKPLRGARQKYASYQLECVGIVEALRHFHNYLFAVEFTLETDCLPLIWLLKQHEPKAMCARMIIEISQYRFQVVHTNGQAIDMADMLSRQEQDTEEVGEPEVNIICGLEAALDTEHRNMSLDRVLEAQKLDEDMENAHELLRKKFEEVVCGFAYDSQGLLCKNTEKGLVIWIPKELVADCLHNQHRTLTGGHLGTRKTIEALRRRFWWRSLGVDTAKFIRQCVSCIERKGRVDPRPAARVTQPPLQVMQRIYIDIVGPLSVTPSGHRWVVTFMEGVSRWLEAVPLVEASAMAVAKALTEQVICRWGVFSELVSDNGKAFLAQLIKEVCKLLGVRQIFISPYHPQGNSVEPAHKGLVNFISQFLDGHESWEDVLPFALYSARANFHTTTQATPSLIMTGRELALPSDILLGPKLALDNLPPTGRDYVRELQKKLKRVREEARNNDCAVRAKSAEKANARLQKQRPIREGDIVYIKKMQKKGKFDNRLKGPYRVIKQRSDVTFDLQSINGQDRVFMWHRMLMRGYLIHQDDAEDKCDAQLEDILEESERAELESGSSGRGGEKVKNGACEGSEAVNEDVCANTARDSPKCVNTKRGAENANSAKLAPANSRPIPIVKLNDSGHAGAQASEPEIVPRKRGRPPKRGEPPSAEQSGAPTALGPQPKGGAIKTSASPGLEDAEQQQAAERKRPAGSTRDESAEREPAEASDRACTEPLSPGGSRYNLRSSSKERQKEP